MFLGKLMFVARYPAANPTIRQREGVFVFGKLILLSWNNLLPQ